MDVVKQLRSYQDVVTCVDMHTTGEITRIVIDGYPDLSGTLLEQRAEAKKNHDHIRRKLLFEPRGHADCYGAILRPHTVLTRSGEAHMGVLFTTNGGYSTMCGHATTALGRFLVDTQDVSVFPQRKHVSFDAESKTVKLVLHAPCGPVEITVPTNEDGTQSDPSRPVSHLSVPAFTTGVGVMITVPAQFGWPELEGRKSVTADFSYGGAFYCFISAAELGFRSGLQAGKINLGAMDYATKRLKAAINDEVGYRHLFSHPESSELAFLYSIIIVDAAVGVPTAHSTKAQTGLCFFADQQVDRSPTGGGVAARVALAFAKDRGAQQDVTTYHSLLSNAYGGRGGFLGSVHEVLGVKDGLPIIRVKIEGYASYIGTSSFVVESNDMLGDDGFLFDRLC